MPDKKFIKFFLYQKGIFILSVKIILTLCLLALGAEKYINGCISAMRVLRFVIGASVALALVAVSRPAHAQNCIALSRVGYWSDPGGLTGYTGFGTNTPTSTTLPNGQFTASDGGVTADIYATSIYANALDITAPENGADYSATTWATVENNTGSAISNVEPKLSVYASGSTDCGTIFSDCSLGGSKAEGETTTTPWDMKGYTDSKDFSLYIGNLNPGYRLAWSTGSASGGADF